MITVKTESQLPDGKVRRRYEVTLTDLLGNTYTEIVGMFNHEPTNNGSEVEAQVLASKKEQEQEQYKDAIRNATNPFEGLALWNTRNELLKAVLDEALSQPATDPITYNGLPYLQLISDAELMTIYSKDQVWVDAIRAQATSLLTAKASLDNYQAVL